MSATLWVPGSAKPKPFRCLVCHDAEFENRAQYQRHVVKCVKRNGERFQRHAQQRDKNYFTGVADKERYAHLRNPAGRKTVVTVPAGIPKSNDHEKGNDDA